MITKLLFSICSEYKDNIKIVRIKLKSISLVILTILLTYNVKMHIDWSFIFLMINKISHNNQDPIFNMLISRVNKLLLYKILKTNLKM